MKKNQEGQMIKY